MEMLDSILLEFDFPQHYVQPFYLQIHPV
jgi:hypothetical protein